MTTNTNAKSETIRLRVKADERALIREQAAAAGMSEATWIRERLGLPAATMGRPRKTGEAA